ncbi:MAG TPA: TA system VapC family ribonuclease toxin [Candidatus Dormibacteraeota bacterium]|jgi:hypothetical protein|nr:TA system VapC family ribonuclease toxin [Candidatus Dormibacteraeota bacterium]
MLVDANILIFAVDSSNPFHLAAKSWLGAALNAETRVGLPWSALLAFLRIVTNPRASNRPLAPGQAWTYIQDWLASDLVWVPQPTPRHADVLGSLVQRYQLRGNLIPDAELAAIAIEHGLAIYSADTDFARFSEITWINPFDAKAGRIPS